MQYLPAVSLSLILVVSPDAIAADQCAPGAPLALEGAADWKRKEHKRRSELSAVVMRGGNLLAISNERTRKRRHVIQVFRPVGANRYVFDHDEKLFQAAKAGCRESDFEAAALHDNRFYAISSHSLSHVKNPGKAKKLGELRQILSGAGHEFCANRYQFLRFPISPDGKLGTKDIATSLRTFLKDPKGLGAYANLPSKENGVDIEGLTVNAHGVFIGFRGPVLRGNHVPILRLAHDLSSRKATTSMIYARFGGRGIRAMTSAGKVVYFLVGPNGDQPLNFQLHKWSGDTVPDGDGDAAVLNTELVCEMDRAIGTDATGKPEGMTVLDQKLKGDGTVASTRFVVVYDHTSLRAEILSVAE